MRTLYEKKGSGRGTRYVPVAEGVALDALPEGFHLVEVRPGSRCVTFDVAPDTAALQAAARPALKAMTDAVAEAAKWRPRSKALTSEQLAAWKAYEQAMGITYGVLEGASAHEIAEAGVKALIAAAKETT